MLTAQQFLPGIVIRPMIGGYIISWWGDGTRAYGNADVGGNVCEAFRITLNAAIEVVRGLCVTTVELAK